MPVHRHDIPQFSLDDEMVLLSGRPLQLRSTPLCTLWDRSCDHILMISTYEAVRHKRAVLTEIAEATGAGTMKNQFVVIAVPATDGSIGLLNQLITSVMGYDEFRARLDAIDEAG